MRTLSLSQFQVRCLMRPHSMFFMVAATTLIMCSTPAFSDTEETTNFDPTRMWECSQADGSSIYTNKERAGCTLMTLKPLSIVPSLENGVPGYSERNQTVMSGDGQHVPGWAKDWQASVAPSGSVETQICSMYGEWLNLVQKTRGGIYYGSDPSYGGDLSQQNQRGASYSFYDNTRYIALSRIFGTGFVPIGCQ